MSLRFAFDVDGVFADMEGALRGLAGSPDQPLSIAPPDRRNSAPVDLHSADQRRIWRAARRTHNFWETLEELEPGALRRLRATSERLGWHVVFFTQRPRTEGDHPQLQTQRWLARHGFEHASVLVVPGARGKLSSVLNLDVVVDDVPDYCADVALESRARPCLVWRRAESDLPPGTRRLGIEVFTSVGACLESLETPASEQEPEPGWAERVGRRLWLAGTRGR
jgi:hypothetical protein